MELISIVIPTYNRKEMLKKCISSILSQTYTNWEIIIVNDCSNYDVEKEVKKIVSKNIKVINNKCHLNAGESRRKGFKACSGKYVIFMDDDDYYIDFTFFEKAISILESNPDLSFVSGQANKYFISEEREENFVLNYQGRIEKKEYLEHFQVKIDKPLSTFTTIFNVSNLLKVDFESVKMVNDSIIYLRALCAGDAFIMSDIVGNYIIHQSNMSTNTSLSLIIDMIIEKYKLFPYVKNMVSNIDRWWYSQYMVTAKFYICGTNPSLMHIYKLIVETKKYTKITPKICISLIKYFIFTKMRRIYNGIS